MEWYFWVLIVLAVALIGFLKVKFFKSIIAKKHRKKTTSSSNDGQG